MHEPVGRVHFVVFEKFTSAYLFQIAREKSCDYLLIIYTMGAGGKLLPIHSLKSNPNDVPTTCKVISMGLASGFVC